MGFFQTFGLGASGWGASMLRAGGTTAVVAVLGFVIGGGIGAILAWATLRRTLALRWLAHAYTTLLRGVPALLVIYLIYFGGSSAISTIAARLFGAGHSGFVGLPPFPTGVVALAIISGAYAAEVLRGAYLAIPRGQFEAAHAMGLSNWRIMVLITFPLAMRYALPGLENVWQMVLKESALISVIGLMDLMGQAQIAAGSTSEPFVFFTAAGVVYIVISSVSSFAFRTCERWTLRGVRTR